MDDTRNLTAEEARQLRPGADHYTAYVGPPDQYDLIGASQFRLLTTLGLRAHHKLLDFGCGSLRAGRFFIPYLLPGNYYGLEPNAWLIEEAVRKEVGQSLVDIKQPVFRHDDDFQADHFGVKFDFILAQSIFSHTGYNLTKTALSSFANCIAPDGVILVTFVNRGEKARRSGMVTTGWVYPGVVAYDSTEVTSILTECNLVGRALPWFHPRQVWYAIALRDDALPSRADDVHLSGVVLRDARIARRQQSRDERRARRRQRLMARSLQQDV